VNRKAEPIVEARQEPLASYVADKIEMRLSFYETQLQRVDAKYLAQVEKLARRTSDAALANTFRYAVDPRWIRSAIDSIRMELEAGQILEADAALERLKNRLEFVEAHLKRPIFRMGLKFDPRNHGPRRDVLARLMDNSLNRLGQKATADAVLDDIRDAPEIQEIDDEKTILWRGTHGEKTTGFKAFQNRLAKRRQHFSQPKK
jgi:hypothetical protein